MSEVPEGDFVKITLSGHNDYMISNELNRLVSDFTAKYGDMAVEKLYGDEVDYQRIYDSLTGLPFLSTQKMVVIRDPSSNKQFLEKAEYLLNNLPDSTDVIFVESRMDKRSSLYKMLKKQTDYRDFSELDENGLASWLVAQAKVKNGSLSSADARFLVERIGTNQQLLSSELSKVLLYDTNINRKTIELTTEAIPQSTIFDLYTDQRALKVEPQQIISMLVWQFHIIALIKSAKQLSTEQIAKIAKINPYVVSKTAKIASKITLRQLRHMIHDLLELDVRLKSESLDTDDALKLYILSLYSQ
jgi:DNA polymerase-3 subunit delta